MNLREFIKYKDKCPICGKDLHLIFHSNKKQKINFINDDQGDRLVATIEMVDYSKTTQSPYIKKNNTYTVEYNILFDENKFFINFYKHAFWNKVKYNKPIPDKVITSFNNLTRNQGPIKLFKYCSTDMHNHTFNGGLNFHNYYYISSSLTLLDQGNYNGIFNELIINNEIFHIYKDDIKKNYHIENDYLINKSSIMGINEQLPLINFNQPIEDLKRYIDMLYTFS